MNQHQVEYLLIGGYAVNLYGFVRATGDMDVFVALTPDNVTRLVAALHEFGFDSVTPELMQPGKILRMGVPPLRLEVLNQISGVEFAEAYAAREMITLGELSIPVISLRHLRANKAASGRPKDLGDLSELPTEDRL
ncbi:nucleotidyltransferase [Deinococcus rubellus]|uniref:Nucleotidyltransferase n=1 Tax=Deinococcus rubellus TaxID=1889240 RepID=A0ABY5YK31_9DEIO|nr:nucleotidyltransferase [Deinococcus rubellus]UWX65170.1 nucleotidyltransferase [Deinococcus rubellus]